MRRVPAEGRAPLQVQYRETSAAAVISDVASGTANLGVVRWQAEHAATLDNLLRENALSGEVLWEFSMVVLLHERHPLAALGDIPYHLLGDYPEIVHGDLTPVLPAEQPAQAAGGRQGRIAVFDRGGQFDILRNVPGSYMWVSPVPFEILAQQELVQKPCRSASRYRDVLVRRRPGALSAAANSSTAMRSTSASPAGSASAPKNERFTSVTPAEAIIATTAGRRPASTPCTMERPR